MNARKGFLLCIILAAACLVIWGFVRGKAAQKSVPDTRVLTEETFTSFNGVDYSLWKDSGDTKMVLKGAGAFECEWKDTRDALFRAGRIFNPVIPAASLQTIHLDYGADYKPEGISFLGAYGWMKDPMIEFYIVENWGTVRPDDRQHVFEEHFYLGTWTVHDAVYDVYSSVRENKPSIDGVPATFSQYWSVRRDPSSSGSIDLLEHFRIWEAAGLPLGSVYEASLVVEGIESSGSADVYRNELTYDSRPSDNPWY